MKLLFVCLVLTLSFCAFGARAEEARRRSRAFCWNSCEPPTIRKSGLCPRIQRWRDLPPEQASWQDGKGNHSIGQLANHLVFWNQEELAKFKGEPPVKFSGDNNETFNNFDSKKWAATVQQLDQVLTDWEKAVEAADDKKLESWYSIIAHIGTHNAYHIGQIIYIRKLQGSWDPEKGVK